MVDPVIDEHFRRSLGADYMNLFGKKQEATAKQTSRVSSSPGKRISSHTNPTRSTTESSQPSTPSSCSSSNRTPSLNASPTRNASPAGVDVVDGSAKSTTTISMSVDDHFAKALGDTWKQLQQAEKQIAESDSGQSDDDEEYFDDDMAVDADDNSSSNSMTMPSQRKKDKSRKSK